MTSALAPLFRALSIALFFPTLIGAAGVGKSAGPVVGWGEVTYGRATTADAVNVFGTATEIAAGGAHSCAIQAGTGNVVCWGSDAKGQATSPDAVNGKTGTATDIAAGKSHGCAIRADTGNVV